MPQTEARNPRSAQLGELDANSIVALMNKEERAAFVAIERVTELLGEAAQCVADIYLAGGRIFLLGAGTSGRLVALEAAELPPTFGVAEDRFVPFIASGPAAVTLDEDDRDAAPRALAAAQCSRADGVIGVAASGTTPFVLAGIAYAGSQGSWTCGLANNSGTPLLLDATVGILLDTGPEILTGSTRLKAATAQKLALNRIFTAGMTLAGTVVSNLMVEVRPTTIKLRERCVRIVGALTGADEEASLRLLQEAGGNVRAAVERHQREHERQP